MTRLYTLVDLTAPGVFLSGLKFRQTCNLAEIGDWWIISDEAFAAMRAKSAGSAP